jgi:hypothetical protein
LVTAGWPNRYAERSDALGGEGRLAGNELLSTASTRSGRCHHRIEGDGHVRDFGFAEQRAERRDEATNGAHLTAIRPAPTRRAVETAEQLECPVDEMDPHPHKPQSGPALQSVPIPPTQRKTVEVKIGVVYTTRELLIETDGKADEVVKDVESALADKGKPVLWLQDRKGRRIGVPVDKIAYIEVGDEENKRVGFGPS